MRLSPFWIKCFAVASFLLIGVPSTFSLWWYLFSSTPPYQWFAEKGFPVIATQPYWLVVAPVAVGLVLLVAILGRRAEGADKAATEADQPQAELLALEDLKRLLSEGEGMLGRFQLGPKSEFPSLQQVEEWRERADTSAKRRSLEKYVTPPVFAKYRSEWDFADMQRIKGVFCRKGAIADDDSTSQLILGHLWGKIRRLEELIAFIEGTESAPSVENRGRDPVFIKETLAHLDRASKEQRQEGDEKRQRIEACLDRYAAVHDRDHLMAVSLLKSECHKLRGNDELVTMCQTLAECGHPNPLDYWRGYVPETDSLAFLKRIAYAPNKITDDVAGAKSLHDAMETWRLEHGYPEPSAERRLDTLSGAVLFPHSPSLHNPSLLRASSDDARVSWEETNKIIAIFRNAPPVKVAVTSLSALDADEFRDVMERAGWLREAFVKAGVDAPLTLWKTLGNIPDGTSICWVKNAQNNEMAARVIQAASVKGLRAVEVDRPSSAGDCEVELMIGRDPTRRLLPPDTEASPLG